jgi:hypothetical protein
MELDLSAFVYISICAFYLVSNPDENQDLPLDFYFNSEIFVIARKKSRALEIRNQ